MAGPAITSSRAPWPTTALRQDQDTGVPVDDLLHVMGDADHRQVRDAGGRARTATGGSPPAPRGPGRGTARPGEGSAARRRAPAQSAPAGALPWTGCGTAAPPGGPPRWPPARHPRRRPPGRPCPRTGRCPFRAAHHDLAAVHEPGKIGRQVAVHPPDVTAQVAEVGPAERLSQHVHRAAGRVAETREEPQQEVFPLPFRPRTTHFSPCATSHGDRPGSCCR